MQVTTDESDARTAEIMRRIDGTGISDRELAEKTGVARGSIAKARKGLASIGVYDRLERWIERFEDETTTNAPHDEVVEFVVTGNFGVSVTVRGPVSDLAALEAAALRFTKNLGAPDSK